MFEEILQGRYERWHGLQPQPTLKELVEWLGPALVHPHEQRNRIVTRFSVIGIERPTAPLNLEAWIPLGSREVAILEIEDPVCVDIEATLDAMGKPETILEERRLAAEYLVYEFVFPQRGINLSVGKPLASAVRRSRSLSHVRLFAPMTLQRYLTSVGEPNPTAPNTSD